MCDACARRAGLFNIQELVDRAAVELAATAPPLHDGKTDVRRESVWTILRNRMKLGRLVLVIISFLQALHSAIHYVCVLPVMCDATICVLYIH
jgi:hypothetical protein